MLEEEFWPLDEPLSLFFFDPPPSQELMPLNVLLLSSLFELSFEELWFPEDEEELLLLLLLVLLLLSPLLLLLLFDVLLFWPLA